MEEMDEQDLKVDDLLLVEVGSSDIVMRVEETIIGITDGVNITVLEAVQINANDPVIILVDDLEDYDWELYIRLNINNN